MSLESFGPKNKKEKAFSEEGLLNRNFGKDIEKPSDALFYRDGILNRAKFQEAARGAQEIIDAPQPDSENFKATGAEIVLPVDQTMDRSEAVNDSFEVTGVEKVLPVGQTTERPKPIMSQLVEQFGNEADPEKAAFDHLYLNLDPNLNTTEKLNRMRTLVKEFKDFKEGNTGLN